MKRESKEAPRVHESPEDDDESEWAKFLSPEARKRYRALREGRLDVDAEMERIESEERVHWTQDPKWAAKVKGPKRKPVDGFGRKERER